MAKATTKATQGSNKKASGRFRSPGQLADGELRNVLKARKAKKSYMAIAEQFRLAPAGNPDGDRATYGRIAVRMALRKFSGAEGEAREAATKLTQQLGLSRVAAEAKVSKASKAKGKASKAKAAK